MRLLIIILSIFFSQLSIAQTDTLVMVHESLVYFDSSKKDIRQDQIATLDSMLMLISQTKNPLIKVVAHTDKVGNDKYNEKLSLDRAKTVAEYFLQNGIDAERLDYSFYGESKPVTVGIDDNSRQQNRRARISVFTARKRQWLLGQVTDKSNEKGIKTNVRMHSRYWADSTNTDVKGNFKILVPKGEIVGLDFVGEGYLLDMRMMKVTPIMEKEPIAIKLDEINVGKKFLLERLFFVGNQDYLLEKSFSILPVLHTFMKVNKGTCIVINGHINLPNAEKTKLNTRLHDLSIARARRIYNYLLSKGISEKRMFYRGFGNWQMVHPKARKEVLMAQNRRVEVIILDCSKSESGMNDTLSVDSHFYKFYHQDYGSNH